MRSVMTLVAFLAAAGSVAANPVPAPQTTQPPCVSVPTNFWLCISDCLYKICVGVDASCVPACDAKCSKLIILISLSLQSRDD
ncbi:hypothetical protein QBC38DRAFT_490885 [Podospora fimiseda]|uniref:Uncharacterized protein n=1 Tax=Podospora fimiseda TaxID=252190 RepID=A0AAN7BFG0_9PEZI|nr:hypothetical protein QBC38DRAFT_490885 [Podospora fimiseda]